MRDIAGAVLRHYPATQAVYLFGSYGTEEEWPDSDADVAILLPAEQAKMVGSLIMSELQAELVARLGRDVDLINLRQMPTVFQKEVIMAQRRIYCADQASADSFEMLVLSLYQKLNQERASILEEGLRSGRFYNV